MRAVCAILLCLGAAAADTEVYSVSPVRASWSGWTRPIPGKDTVKQVITLNVDTLKRVEVFIGFSEGAGGYNINVLSYPNGTEPLARASELPPAGNHVWLPFDLTIDHPDSFVKGRRYRVEVTRSGSDSIQYYYSQDNPYPYGSMPGDHAPNNADLALRAYGVMDTIGADWFGVNPFFPFGGETWGCSKNTWKTRANQAGLHNARFRINWAWMDSGKGPREDV